MGTTHDSEADDADVFHHLLVLPNCDGANQLCMAARSIAASAGDHHGDGVAYLTTMLQYETRSTPPRGNVNVSTSTADVDCSSLRVLTADVKETVLRRAIDPHTSVA
jgi:hypothetical protein